MAEKVENSLLEVSRLTKVFPLGVFMKRKHLRAVDDVSFDVPADKATITTLAGESGSGKTTIAKIILGLLEPTSGEIRYKGRNIRGILKEDRRSYRREVQGVFQDPYGTYNPFYRVNRILELPIKKFGLASSKNETQQIISDSLNAVGLTSQEVLGKYPHQLSGGQLQRIMLARALLSRPKLVVADEPVSMIDASLRAGILNQILDLKEKYNVPFLFVTHDLSVAYYLSDYIIILYRGRIMEKGKMTAVAEERRHPYTQLLMGSIPIPNPEKRWETKEKEPSKESGIRYHAETAQGCVFLDRCPHARDNCAKERPQLIGLEKNHQVACHLYY